MKNHKKNIALFTASIIAASTLVACNPSEPVVQKIDEDVEQEGKAETSSAKGEVVEEASEEKADDAIEVSAKVGETLQFEDLNITLNKVRKAKGTNEWDQPTKDHFLIFDVVVENAGDEPFAMSSVMNFTAMDADGYSQDLTVFAETRGSLDGEIGPGRKLAGEIAFDVEDSNSYEFIFQDLFKQGQAIWQVTSADINE